MFATTVAISTSVVTKDAFAVNPISSCFIANAIINPSYYRAEQNFINLLPNDKLFTKLSAVVGNGSIQNNAYLYTLLTNPGIDDKQKNDALDEVSSLLTQAVALHYYNNKTLVFVLDILHN